MTTPITGWACDPCQWSFATLRRLGCDRASYEEMINEMVGSPGDGLYVFGRLERPSAIFAMYRSYITAVINVDTVFAVFNRDEWRCYIHPPN